ncbi:hypothetical protein DS2_13749 [Catenovulum agarivorans DS-2]|uniref:Uncharacterized protein n=1 Tax=Catenovulum agarivorans DS-2 TaxID=1328313 RepID=W7Q8T2_9ALTE|nr:hypothetical protein [Catenovulum agarivorans]EWH09229.1 hypothetical protein DS2_13749 [Catenovulum agarivorans DS-2]
MTRHIVLSSIGILALSIFYLANYGEESIKVGSVNGISIGDSKSQAYENLHTFLAKYRNRGDKIFIRIRVSGHTAEELATDPGFGVLIEPRFHKIGKNKFQEKDRWVFYLNADSLDVIELRFENNKLVEVYRNKRLFELP